MDLIAVKCAQTDISIADEAIFWGSNHKSNSLEVLAKKYDKIPFKKPFKYSDVKKTMYFFYLIIALNLENPVNLNIWLTLGGTQLQSECFL